MVSVVADAPGHICKTQAARVTSIRFLFQFVARLPILRHPADQILSITKTGFLVRMDVDTCIVIRYTSETCVDMAADVLAGESTAWFQLSRPE